VSEDLVLDVTKDIDSLREYLQWSIEGRKQLYQRELAGGSNRKTPFVTYWGMDDLILAKAVEYQGEPLPEGMEWGVPKSCFQNSYQMLWKSKRYIYVEGYVVIKSLPLPIHHAWLTTAKNPGAALDRTLNYKSHEVTYYGIPFKTEHVREMHKLSKRRYYNVLDCWWTHFDLYSKTDEEINGLIDKRGMKSEKILDVYAVA
jgi:hypothetical protein